MIRVECVVLLLSFVIYASGGYYENPSFLFPGQTRYARQDFVFPDQSGFGGWQSPWIQPTNPPKLNQRVSNRPGQAQGPLVNRVDDERISQRKCREYAKLSEKKTQFSTLSLDWSTLDLSEQQCDISSGLIIGGVTANPKEFPHMAAIGYRNSLNNDLSFGCGGSLISERHVLTAAHCRLNGRIPASVVRLGVINLITSPADDYGVEKFLPHEFYNPESKLNDIAVITLSRFVDFKDAQRIRPACLWAKPQLEEKTTIASGWGYTTYGGQVSQDLMKVKLDILDVNICVDSFDDREDIVINDSQICAGVLAGNRDTCQGDSGGPIQVAAADNKCQSYVIGITSYGGYCGGKNSPSVYTRISSFIDWIEKVVWE